MSDAKSFFAYMEGFSDYGLANQKLCYFQRYVRQWLGAMSAAKIISVESNEDQEGSCVYSLSEEHFDIVKSRAIFGKGAFACHSRMDILMSCFWKDGPPGDSKAFQGETWEFFEEFREKSGEKEMLKVILPRVQSLPDFEELLGNGCRVLDLGCVSGMFTLSMAERYPKSTFVSIDVVDDCLERARVQCERKCLSNVTFIKTTMEAFAEDLDDKLDIVTSFLVLHNLSIPITVVRHIYSSLKPSGKLILLENEISSNHLNSIGNMSNAFVYSISLFFCLPCSMSDKPHIGYGTWGKDDMLKSLEEYFVIEASFKLGYSTGLHLLTKRAF